MSCFWLNVTSQQVNEAACAVAARVRDARGGLVAGGLTQTGIYKPGQDCKAQAMAEELAPERGRLPEASSKSDHNLAIHAELEGKGLVRYKNKGNLDWWMRLQPATGRPLSMAMAPRADFMDKPSLLTGGMID